ncbi:hypothetical protein L3N51_01749 [Metallosphaera sp. J1]|uniref:hypothetical protein n=1 Tax=Metallosphaera javensis (ex Hofmann et al. 2022) TaxID=99938 RepID=UPI001EDCE67E|nr:hypothetical protein [Metallosphaera javensis (ex Hofmann et al. 2022)]MCG3109457.1 hypothetical protein [Metallosphaera javensis (ex Hofmann et al. 2022)]
MRLSRGFQIFRIVFRERYREPTLELVLPTMLVANIFLSAFYERGNFSLLGVVLGFTPVISVAETLAFALGLRNVIFVTGDHVYKGSIISFLTMPVRREILFLYIYFADVVIPWALWLVTSLLYSQLSGIRVPSLLLATFTSGYFFSLNVVFLLTILLKSPGVATLTSMFVLGSIFVFGGALGYYQLIQGNTSLLYLSSFSNPYVLWIADSLGRNLISQIISGVWVDGVLAVLALLFAFFRFRGLEP